LVKDEAMATAIVLPGSTSRIVAPVRALVAMSGVLALAAAAAACAPDPLVFPDWTVRVPDGTPMHEYRYVPLEERTDRLAFERDLVISEGLGRGLYRPGAVDVADDGTIWVLDTGNFRVVAFDQQGNALREFGREGQGPGEFQRPTGFGVAGDRVVVSDTGTNRLSVFSGAGELVADRQFDERMWARSIRGHGDELLMVVAPPTPFGGSDEPPTVPWLVGRYTQDGEQLAALIELEASMRAYLYTSEVSSVLSMTFANPVAAFAPGGTVYLTGGGEYQIVAVAPDASPVWALRTTFVPETLSVEQKEELRTHRLESMPEAIRAEVANARYVWPDRFAALDNIAADGRGNLFAFPYTYRPPETDPGPDQPVAVDVYSSGGAALFSGLTAINGWDAAFGEHVYRLEEDPGSGEQVVVRYRLSGLD
jgi:hypothetical protein